MSFQHHLLNPSDEAVDEDFWKELEQTPINMFPSARFDAFFSGNEPAEAHNLVKERMSIANLINDENSSPQPGSNPPDVLQDISNHSFENQVQTWKPAGYPNCFICSNKFDLHIQLEDHLITDHGYPPRRCPHCDFTSDRLPNLKRHVKSMHDSRSERYHCYACNFSTLDEDEIRFHVSSTHCKCPYCFCSFVRLSSHERVCRMHPRNQEVKNQAEGAGPAPASDGMERDARNDE